jgi:hypothetical protein
MRLRDQVHALSIHSSVIEIVKVHRIQDIPKGPNYSLESETAN